jgi:hypothetical protein
MSCIIPSLYLVCNPKSQFLKLFGSNLLQNINLCTCFQNVWQEFCMQKLHFLLDNLNKPIFHNNLDICFSTFPYTHTSNTLLIDYAPYKSVFNNLYNAIFFKSFDGFHGEDQCLLGSIIPYLENLIHLDTMFPPLLNTIPWVGLDVLIKII